MGCLFNTNNRKRKYVDIVISGFIISCIWKLLLLPSKAALSLPKLYVPSSASDCFNFLIHPDLSDCLPLLNHKIQVVWTYPNSWRFANDLNEAEMHDR